jgi:hypothetical protein
LADRANEVPNDMMALTAQLTWRKGHGVLSAGFVREFHYSFDDVQKLISVIKRKK